MDFQVIEKLKKAAWIRIVAWVLIISGALVVIDNVVQAYPWIQLRLAIYPYANDRQAIAEGEALYRGRCVGCHGAKGELAGHSHSIKTHISMHYPASYYQVITYGQPKYGMPAFNRSLSNGQRWKIVSFIFSRFNGAKKEASAKRVGRP